MSKFHFVHKEPIKKGWSGDKKYHVIDDTNTSYLLRTSPKESYNSKKSEFDMMKVVASLDVPICTPLEFGIAKNEVYSIQKWIDGDDFENVLPTLSESEQYRYGHLAGQYLKKIHSIPAPADTENWETYFNRKIDTKIRKNQECPLKHPDSNLLVDYLNTHRDLLKNRPITFQHGDYHVGNMMLDKDGILHIIDFNRCDYGDPWEEFNRIVWCAELSPLFATGMVNGYFDNCVPDDFWKLLALYIASNTLGSVSWAIPFGEKEVNTMLNQASEILEWYENMTKIVPKWYLKNYF